MKLLQPLLALVGSTLIQAQEVIPKDSTAINDVLSDIFLDLELNVSDRTLQTTFSGLDTIATAVVGEEGECWNLGLFDYSLTSVLNETTGLVDVELSLNPFRVNCAIPVRVYLTSIGGNNVSDLNVERDNPTLFFNSSEITITQALHFNNSGGLITGDTGSCFTNVGNPTFAGSNITYVFCPAGRCLSTIELDMTNTIIISIEDDPDLVLVDIEVEICKFVTDLGADIIDLLAELIPDDVLNFPDPFLSKVGEPQADFDLLDLSGVFSFNDDGNLIRDALITETGVVSDEPGTLYTFSDVLFEVDNVLNGTTFDPIMMIILEEILIAEDIVALNSRTLEANVTQFIRDLEPEGFDIDLEDIIEGTENLSLSLFLEFPRVFAEVVPVDYEAGEYTLGDIYAYGDQTADISKIELGDILLKGTAHVQFSAFGEISLFESEGIFLDLDLDEEIDFEITWDDLSLRLALFAAVSIKDFNAQELQGVIDELVGCIAETFLDEFRLPGASVSNDLLNTLLQAGIRNGEQELLISLVSDVINGVIPIYRPYISNLASYLVDYFLFKENLVDLLDIQDECAVQDPETDVWEENPYDFTEGIFNDVYENVDVETASDLLDALAADGLDLLNLIFGDEVKITLNLTLDEDTPVEEVPQLNITFVQIDLLGPPGGEFGDYLKSATLFDVVEDSPLFPQQLTIDANISNDADEPAYEVVLGIEFSYSNYVEETDSTTYEENLATIRILPSDLTLFLDMYLKYSEYDVLSQNIGGLLEFDCWTGRLEPATDGEGPKAKSGGVEELLIQFGRVDLEVECDCPNQVLTGIAELLGSHDPAVLQSFEDFINEYILLGIKNYFNFLYKPEWASQTISDARTRCLNLGETPIDLGLDPVHEIDIVLYYIGAFFVALLTPLLLRKKGNHGEKTEIHDKFEVEMYKQPLIPAFFRFIVPIYLVGNFIMFIFGDTGVAADVNVIFAAFGFDLSGGTFTSLSVISTARFLWQNGGIVLALVLFIVSIGWPYLKLLLVAVAFAVPPEKMENEAKARFVEWLDLLGRFSLAEFYFLVMVLIVFDIDTGSPDESWLPEDDFIAFEFLVVPQISLFLFSLAVILSILLSNIMLILQHRVVNAQHESHLTKQQKEYLAEEGKKEFGILDYDVAAAGGVESRLTSAGKKGLACSLILTMGVFLSIIVVKSLHLEINGLIGILASWANDASRETSYDLSILDLCRVALNIFVGTENAYVVIFSIVVLIWSVLAAPFFLIIVHAVILLKSMSLQTARVVYEIHHFLTVWSCVDVFILAIALMALELTTVSERIVESIDGCADIKGFMDETLYRMGIIDETTAEAGCLRFEAELMLGSYLQLLFVFLLALNNVVLGGLLRRGIKWRAGILRNDEGEVLALKGTNLDTKETTVVAKAASLEPIEENAVEVVQKEGSI
eukprot:snap_masked-scaffold_8-processed-gene-7.44-mRNA-1 protein AED:1.00 eAED:1.00 QI:0/0/0/0/1/1/2/0/1424